MPGQTASIQVLRSSRSSTTLVQTGPASMLVAPAMSSYAPLGGGDAAAGPMVRRGPSSHGTVSVTVKKSVPAGLASGGSSPIRRATATPGSLVAATGQAQNAADAASGARVVKQTVGTPVAASSGKARMATSTTQAASRLAAASQLRAVSLEYSHADLTAATDNWSTSRRLGSGKHGSVFKAELKDGSQVAVKAIDLAAVVGAGDSPEDAGFDEEVIMLSKFRHPNLVTLLGWGSHGSSRYLVYELLSGGDLFRRLHKSRSQSPTPFPWHERLSVCLDAATGLSHMHNSTPKAFHRDIKSANILLDRHGTAKMADFGLSCSSSHAGADHVDVRFASGTPGYRCPLYEKTGRVSEASEAYSFCMVMLEVLLGLDPSMSNSKVPGGLSYPITETVAPARPGAEERCLRALDAKAGWPVEVAREIAALAVRGVCAYDDRQRPPFVEIVKTLRSLTERFPPSFTSASAPPVAEVRQVVEVQGGSQRVRPASVADQMMQKPVTVQATPVLPLPPRGREAEVAKIDSQPALVSDTDISETTSEPPEYPYLLELTLATGAFVELSDEQRFLPLKPRIEGSACIAAVGRGQQAELFEAWLPDARIRTCVSRNAFEISWLRETRDPIPPCLTALGSGPVSVEGQVVAVKTPYVLQHGSEIGLLYGKQLLVRFRFHDMSVKGSMSLRSYIAQPSSPQSRAGASPQNRAPLVPASPAVAQRNSGPSSGYPHAAQSGTPVSGQASVRGASTRRTRDRSNPSFTGSFIEDMEFRTSIPGVPQAQAQAQAAPRSTAAATSGTSAANAVAPPVVCLELWGDQVANLGMERRSIGPVSLAGKPLLVGSRHQPHIANDAALKGFTNIVDRDHFCIASEGGVFWLLCLTSKGLWRVREGVEPQRLILDDLASLQHGDVVVPRLGSELSVEQCCRTLSWRFTVLLEPS